ncbi:MAG TPA: helix-turn-helix domain-containing protein [Bacteroidales bacterium]|nr:helix-turn-helix domain-containing protein [Bacteroidales bacterium]HPS16409.1 helix-turn-helix domain-containing protein [Bacteroidales bacterium]
MKAYLKVIETKKDYEIALKKFQELFHAKAGSEAEKEAKLLALLIEDYENKHFHIPEPDPIEAIKYMMEQSQMNQKDLAEILGNKGNVSKVLNRKRKLSIEMIRTLSKCLHIPADILIKDYPLAV